MDLATRVISRALRSPALRPMLARLKDAYAKAQRSPEVVRHGTVEAGMPEVTPLDCTRAGGELTASRLNVVVPALSQMHFFGGLATALRCANALRPSFDCVRIIVTDEQEISPPSGHFFSAWPVHHLRQVHLLTLDQQRENHVLVCGDRWACTLPVAPCDVFMATAWWTAHLGFEVLDWQDRTFGPTRGGRRLLYLIQDFEPGFYPWSSRHVLAENTYRLSHRTVAVFNTGLLAEHFRRHGFRFNQAWTLEPRLNPLLAQVRRENERFVKQRVLLVYGRPSVARNAFEIILAGLRHWATTFPQARTWQVLSVGESFGEVPLGGGCALKSLEKLPLNDYAELLIRSAVGVSLMWSPHPSYPPLEMAAFGLRVITNVFQGKDLSTLSPQFHSLDPVHPAALSRAMTVLCEDFESRTGRGGPVVAVQRDDIQWSGPFLQEGPELQAPALIAADVLAHLSAGSTEGSS